MVRLLVAALLLPTLSAAEGKTKVVFLPIRPLAGFSAETAETMGEFMQSEVMRPEAEHLAGVADLGGKTAIPLSRPPVADHASPAARSAASSVGQAWGETETTTSMSVVDRGRPHSIAASAPMKT